MKNLLTFFMLLLVFTKSNAQCPFTVTAISTESRCKETGTITLTPSIAGAYTYQVTSGPKLTGLSSSNIFAAMPAGNYIVTTTLGGCSAVTTNINVAGTYSEPGVLTATNPVKVGCIGGTNGCLTANQPTNGRAPFSYSITSGPVTRPLQSSNSFCGLPVGNYTLQAFDSCGVIRSSSISVASDTGVFDAYTPGYYLQYANCNDLIACPLTGITGSSSHTKMKIWYIKPNGDTLKINGFETLPISCDTLVGEAHTYGIWQMLAYDTCGNLRSKTSFEHLVPSMSGYVTLTTCNKFNYTIGNSWKFGMQVGYRVKKCSDNSVVYNYVVSPPAGWASIPFSLDFDTCYKFEHFNNCGDTVFGTYNFPKPTFKINSTCASPGCSENGTGNIRLDMNYLTGVFPVTFNIISGPSLVGSSYILTSGATISLDNIPIGTYKIAGIDACGKKDTINLEVNKPLNRIITVTETPSCNGGTNVHVKVTSNFSQCNSWYLNNSSVVSTSPSYTPQNIISGALVTSTTTGVWEADYLNVTAQTLTLTTGAPNSDCTRDTVITLHPYKIPTLVNVSGFQCVNNGLVSFTLLDGKAPFEYRIKPQTTGVWTAFQASTLFPGTSLGTYEVEVRDACPNGSNTTFSINPWLGSNILLTPNCATIGQPFSLTANPNINGPNYNWSLNGAPVGVGSQLNIPNYQLEHNGIYTLQQTFPGGGCTQNVGMPVYDCFTLPISISDLAGFAMDSYNKLNWASTKEDLGNSYTIERSNNGVNFVKIGETVSTNTSSNFNYSFEDKAPLQTSFYRIKVIEYNNAAYTKNTNTIKLIQKDKALVVNVSPNPFADLLDLKINSTKNEVASVRIYEMSGKLVSTATKKITSGYNIITLNSEIKNLAAGSYFIEIQTSSNKSTFKIIRR